MGPWHRFAALSLSLLLVVCAPVLIMRRYGRQAGRRYLVGSASLMCLQQTLVGLTLLRSARARSHRSLTAVDALTLSRGAAADVLVGITVSRVRDRRGAAGWLGWLALVYGAIPADWLDGPLARRYGSSAIGEVFDLEADSWLTLCSALAAARWGGLPAMAGLPSAARYPLLRRVLRRISYRQAGADFPWARRSGIIQMTLFLAALAPFGGPITRCAVRLAAPLVIALQAASICAQYGRWSDAKRA